MKNDSSPVRLWAFPMLICALLQNTASFSQTISEGGHHSLFLCQNTTAMSCGWSDFGQLGNIDSYPWPIPAFQLPSPASVIKVACGDWHSLFLKSDSTVMASGKNNLGSLGIGNTDYLKTTPLPVLGLTGIVDVAAGDSHSLFLKSDGTVWACGYNFNGQLGDGTTFIRSTPIQIPNLTNVVAIAAGGGCSFFIKSDGTAWACGFNIYGQLGDSTTINRNTPVQVYGLTNVIAAASSGTHTLFLKSDGTAWGTGVNTDGQFGTGNTWQRIAPIQATNLSGIIGIATGYGFTVFLKNDSTAWTSGNNDEGALGDGTTVNKSTPVQVLNGVVNVAACHSSSVFVKSNGTVWCSGENNYGLTGDGVTTNSLVPVQATGLSDIVYAQAGNTFNCLLIKNDGTAWGFGNHQYGQLGGFTNPLQLTSVPVTGLSGIKAVSAGRESSLFLMNDSTVWGVGNNYWGQLGDSSGINRPKQAIQIPGLTGVIAISTFELHSLFLKSDSTVWACGENSQGALGDGTNITKYWPVQVQGLTGVKAISAGSHNSLFLKSDGTAWACGINGGQFGNGTTNNSNVPVPVTSVSGVAAIAAGSTHSLFLKSDGTVWASGQNNSGQLGNGTNIASTIAVQTLIDSVTAIVVAPAFSLFRRTDGTAWACGTNSSGQLGDSTLFNYTAFPFQIPGLSGVVEIEANASTSLFAKSDGSVWGCGTNKWGQLGDSTIIQRNSVVQIQNLCIVATPVYELPVTRNSVVLFPNPTSGAVTVESSSGNPIQRVTVYGVDGRIIKSFVTGNSSIVNLDLSALNAGIYFLDCSGEKSNHRLKMVKY